jgi:hypothetical protein
MSTKYPKSGHCSWAAAYQLCSQSGGLDAKRRFTDPMFHQPSVTMRLHWPAFAVALVFLATPSDAEPGSGGRLLHHVQNSRPVIPVSDEVKPPDSETDIFALMSGKCSTLKVAGRDFACRAVAFFQSDQGRANFAIALDDPTDPTHIVTFSGQNGRREQENNLYELPIDRMLLNSKDRPKADGLPVPSVELSAGLCKQLGNIATGGVSSIACTATDKNGRKYELQFETDGSPMTVRRIRRSSLTDRRRVILNEQRECRHKADAAKVLPRDLTAYIIGCLEDHSQTPAPDSNQ